MENPNALITRILEAGPKVSLNMQVPLHIQSSLSKKFVSFIVRYSWGVSTTIGSNHTHNMITVKPINQDIRNLKIWTPLLSGHLVMVQKSTFNRDLEHKNTLGWSQGVLYTQVPLYYHD